MHKAHMEHKALVFQNIETIFEHPEVSEREAPGLLGEIQGLLGQLNTAANTLRVQKALNDALAKDPTLNLGGFVTINGTSFRITATAEGDAPTLMDESGAPF